MNFGFLKASLVAKLPSVTNKRWPSLLLVRITSNTYRMYISTSQNDGPSNRKQILQSFRSLNPKS